MKILPTPVLDLMVVETSPIKDKRGTFSRLYCEKELERVIDSRRILQVNYSQTDKVGAVRGMHFQHPPYSEMKLVRCIRGKVWDVAVDLRASSATFLHWHAVQLSSANNYMMVIPEGFAHGFQCLEAGSELLYLHTAFYNRETESGLNYKDPTLGIKWPLRVTDLSPADTQRGFIERDYKGIAL